MKKIKVDFDLCESNAMCEALAPEPLRDRRRRLPADPRRERQRRRPRDRRAGRRLVPQVRDQHRRRLSRPPPHRPHPTAVKEPGHTMPENPDPTSLEGRVAVVTGAGAGLGRAEALALARAGANVVLNDLPGAAEEAAEEVRSHGVEALVVARRRGGARHRRRDAAGGHREARPPRHRREQRRHHPRQDAVQHDRRGLRPRPQGAPARTLPALAQRGGVLARALQGDRRAGGRRGREHGLRGVPRRLARPGRTTRRPRPASPR